MHAEMIARVGTRSRLLLRHVSVWLLLTETVLTGDSGCFFTDCQNSSAKSATCGAPFQPPLGRPGHLDWATAGQLFFYVGHSKKYFQLSSLSALFIMKIY